MKILIATLFLVVTQSSSARTLIIADSHGEGAFGTELVRLIELQKKHVSAFAVGGSSPVDWTNGNKQIWGYWEHHTGTEPIRLNHPVTPKFANLIDKEKPNTVLIVQGTNLIWRDLKQEDLIALRELISLVSASGAKCYWIGPPDLRLVKIEQQKRILQIQEMLQVETQYRCELIKSWELISYPIKGGDGIHYDQIPFKGPELARTWARKVINNISLPTH